MQQIKSLNVIQAAKILAALYFVFGLAFAVLCVFLALVERGHLGHRGLAMAVLSPFFYGVAGFVLAPSFVGYTISSRRVSAGLNWKSPT